MNSWRTETSSPDVEIFAFGSGMVSCSSFILARNWGADGCGDMGRNGCCPRSPALERRKSLQLTGRCDKVLRMNRPLVAVFGVMLLSMVLFSTTTGWARIDHRRQVRRFNR